jgi:hypothetical protein
VDIVVVLVLGLAAGIGVYLVSMRWDGPAAVLPGEGFLPEEERMQTDALQAAAEAAAGRQVSGDYVPLAPGRRSTQTRLLGLLGIVVLVPIAAVTFALAAYGVGRVIVEALNRLLQNASA